MSKMSIWGQLAVVFAFCMGCVFTARAEVTFTPVDHLVQDTWKVPAGQCYQASFTLTQGSVVYGSYKIQGAVDSRLDIELMDEFNFGLRRIGQRYSKFNAMSGTVNGIARLKFDVPKSGTYVALFCNSKAVLFDRLVSVNLYTTRQDLNPAEENLRAVLEKIVQKLHQGFKLPDFDLALKPCGIENAFSDPNITLCTELVDSLDMSTAAGADVLMFVFFHEFAHTALHLWDMPGADNEDTADEFAAALLLFLNQNQIVESTANWWLSKAGNVRVEALSKIGVDDRHSLSIQRARNLHRWSGNLELAKRWLNFWAPHFTDSGLKDVAKDSRYSEVAAIQAEMTRRGLEQSVRPAASAAASSAVATPSAASTGLTARLKELKEARDAGLLTEKEYRQQRQKALGN